MRNKPFGPLQPRFVLILTTILLFGFFNQPTFAESETPPYELDIRLMEDTDATIYDFSLPEDEFVARGFDHTDPSVQTLYDENLTKLKDLHNFSFEDPLFVLNPYGTVTNGLYVYFEGEETDFDVNYTVTTEGNQSDHVFERTLNDASSSMENFESLLIGLVPGELNHVVLEQTDANGDVMNTLEFDVNMPKTKSFYPNNLIKQDGESTFRLSDGLFYLVGTSQFGGYTYFFDNDGVMRAEIQTTSYRFDNMAMYDGQMIFSNTSTEMAAMNSLGQITEHYPLSGYNLHHDFIPGRDGEMLVLASIWDGEEIRREDIVLSLNLNSGRVQELIDLEDLLADYMAVTTPTYDTAGNPTDLDWIHINSIEKISEDEVILSSRETSTLIKISQLYDDPQVNYLIGSEAVWANTDYSELLLDQVSDFPMHAGQHSLNFSQTAIQDEDEYYITFYNNNYWRYLTRPDFLGHIDEENSQNFEPNPDDSSYFYRYVIDETAGTFDLVQSFPVPYSSIVSNVDPQDNNNYVINSGKANTVGEYDADGNLIASFDYTSGNFTYRVFKDTFNDFWFAE